MPRRQQGSSPPIGNTKILSKLHVTYIYVVRVHRNNMYAPLPIHTHTHIHTHIIYIVRRFRDRPRGLSDATSRKAPPRRLETTKIQNEFLPRNPSHDPTCSFYD